MNITDKNCVELISDDDNPYLGDFSTDWKKYKYFKFKRSYYKYIGWELFVKDSPRVYRYKK